MIFSRLYGIFSTKTIRQRGSKMKILSSNFPVSVTTLLVLGTLVLGTNASFASIAINELGQEKEYFMTGDTPVSYTATGLLNGSTTVSSAIAASVGSPGSWTYFDFFGVAGDLFDAEAHRTTSQMDPIMGIWFGTITDTSPGALSMLPLGVGGSGGTPGMTYVDSADDNFLIPHGVGGAFADPKISVVLPSTGLYTIAVADFFGSGPADADGTVPFELHINSGASVIPEATTIVVWSTLGLMGFVRYRRRLMRT